MRAVMQFEKFVQKYWILGLVVVLILVGWVFGVAKGLAVKVTDNSELQGTTVLQDLSKSNIDDFRHDIQKRAENDINFRPTQLDLRKNMRTPVGETGRETR